MISIEGSRHIYAIEGIIGIIGYQRLKIASKDWNWYIHALKWWLLLFASIIIYFKFQNQPRWWNSVGGWGNMEGCHVSDIMASPTRRMQHGWILGCFDEVSRRRRNYKRFVVTPNKTDLLDTWAQRLSRIPSQGLIMHDWLHGISMHASFFGNNLTAYICNSAMHVFDMCNCQTISDACPSWKPVAHPVSLHPTQGLPLGLRKACDHDVQWPACGWRGEARGWSPVQGWGGLCFPEHPMEWLARSETFHCFALPAW